MRSGKLRHRVLIERFYQEKDEGGDFIKEWRQLATTWASVEPLKDGDYWAALSLETVTTHKVTMRGQGEACRPKPADRIILLTKGNRILRIVSVQDTEERGRELVLICEEVSGETWAPPEGP
ncbi:head-tail adaptor protein [Candidatus Darwinibacter acetoxidans]|jgi:head-tail adaptor